MAQAALDNKLINNLTKLQNDVDGLKNPWSWLGGSSSNSDANWNQFDFSSNNAGGGFQFNPNNPGGGFFSF